MEVTTGMGVPTFRAAHRQSGRRASTSSGIEVSTGNPHFVDLSSDNADFEVAGRAWQTIGAEICFHPDFPHQTNVEFVRILNPDGD